MKTISHTKSFEMPHPIAELFPLLSPEGEKYWVPGWDYENAYGEFIGEWRQLLLKYFK